MNVTAIGSYQQVQQAIQTTTKGQGAQRSDSASFANMLGEAFNDLKELQAQADLAATQVATGQPVELHEAMIAMEKASVGFQLGLQVRNKVVEAYQEIMRMQI